MALLTLVAWRPYTSDGPARRGAAISVRATTALVLSQRHSHILTKGNAPMEQIPEQNLRIPGPTPIPPEVAAALSRLMINHRGPEFADILGRVTAQLQHFFQTGQPILGFPSAGTGMQEAAIVNAFSPGDEVLAVTIAVFGNR